MKKLLLSIILLGGAFVNNYAQDLVFTYEGTPVENGATIKFEGYETKTYESMPGYVEYKVDPHINILSNQNTLVNISVVSNEMVNLCAGGACVSSENPSKEKVQLIGGTPLDLQLDYADESYDGEDVEIPEIKMVITAYSTSNPSNKITLNVTMGGFTAAVESLSVNSDIVTIKGKALNFNLNQSSPLSVYSLSGKTLINKTVSGSGSIDLSTLPAGVYVYKMGRNGKTGKFIIR